jgi:hypothetical protein
LATTAAQGCILGASLAPQASQAQLEQAYGVFAQEVQEKVPGYCPQSVNTDGWEATQQAWKHLFPNTTLLLCFLHSVLAIVKQCRRDKALYTAVSDKLWTIYHSESRLRFMYHLRKLPAWALENVAHEGIQHKLLHLDEKASQFTAAYEHPEAYRTSNQVDRLMRFQSRLLSQMQYFHGSLTAAQAAVRSMALLWNFHPYCQRTQRQKSGAQSPFETLNGFRYHDNWFRNLMIAASLNGRGGGCPEKHRLS